MKTLKYITLLFLCSIALNAQIHEIGVFGGGSNFIGDVGPTNYIKPNEVAIGAIYKWNKSPRHSWRASIIRSRVEALDANSDNAARVARNYGIENTVIEISAGYEFNFFEFNQHEKGVFGTPYLYSGLSYFNSEDLFINNNKYVIKGNSWGLAIPIVAGFKFKLSNHLVLGLESGVRFTFQDDLDGSYPKDESLKALRFGNGNSNDWFVFTGLSVTYSFGKKPCYCKDK